MCIERYFVILYKPMITLITETKYRIFSDHFILSIKFIVTGREFVSISTTNCREGKNKLLGNTKV